MKQADTEIISLLEQIAAGSGGGGAESDPTALKIANNLSDLADAGAARTNLALVPGANVQAYNVNLDTWAGLAPSANGQSLVTASNYAAMRALLDLEVGVDVQAYDADLTTWAGITPGTGVSAALAVNVGSAGAFLTFNGAGGTPSSLTLTNATGLPISTGVSGLGTGIATFLGTPSSANLLAAMTDKTGTGLQVFGTSPTLITPNIGVATGTSLTAAGTTLTLTGGSAGLVLAAGGTNQNITLTPSGTGSTSITKLVASGTASFAGMNNSGSYEGNGYIAALSGGSYKGILYNTSANGLAMASDYLVRWSSTTDSTGSKDTGLSRNTAGVVEINNGTAGTFRDLKLRRTAQTEYIDHSEMTAPTAPAANTARVYAENNGAGKTRLMVIFPSGAAQQLAIEP